MRSSDDTFWKLLEKRFGIDMSHLRISQKRNLMRFALRRRMSAEGVVGIAAYLNQVKRDSRELRLLRNEVVVYKTLFFRHREQFRRLIRFAAERSGEKTLKVWSIGCSTGQEPYSIAMSIASNLPRLKLKILATDVHGDLLAIAKGGMYPRSHTRRIPPSDVSRYFQNVGKSWVQIKNIPPGAVRFLRHDIVTQAAPAGKVDVIFLRNTLFHFNERARLSIACKVGRALAPGGLVFVAPNERLPLGDRWKKNRFGIYQRVT